MNGSTIVAGAKSGEKNEMRGLGGGRKSGKVRVACRLDEAPAAAFGVDPLEPLDLLPHFDDTEGGHEETDRNRHETINGSENIVQGDIAIRGDGCDAEVLQHSRVQLVGLLLARAEVASNGDQVRRIEVAAARELVLKRNATRLREASPHLMKLCALAERVEPHEGTDDGDSDGVENETPVEGNEADRNVVTLDDGEDGEEPGDSESDTEDETGGQVSIAEDHVQQETLLVPYLREDDGDDRGQEEAEAEECVEAVQNLHTHFVLLEDGSQCNERGGKRPDGVNSGRKDRESLPESDRTSARVAEQREVRIEEGERKATVNVCLHNGAGY